MPKLLVALIPLALIASGCMTEEQRLVGKWRGTVEIGPQAKNFPFGSMAGGMANMVDPQLDLKADKTFTLYISFAPIEGTWTFANEQIVLKPKKMMGMSADDVKKRAQDQMDRAMPGLPFGMMGDLPGTADMKVQVLNHGEKLSLDPGAGTIAAGLGKMTFKKV